MRGESPVTPWLPEYPAAKDGKVSMLDFELQTFLSDQRPGISVNECPIESPACFWIDRSHIYLRANWAQWCTVSLSSPGHVAALCAARHCRVFYSVDNEIGEAVAPVYHVAALPAEIFPPEGPVDGSAQAEPSEPAENCDEYIACQNKIGEIVKSAFPNLHMYPNVVFDGDHVAVAVANDSLAALLDVLPENRDFAFAPDSGKNLHNPMKSWESDVVSLDFVAKLRRLRTWLKTQEPDSDVEIGLVANRRTLEQLRAFAEGVDIGDLHMFTYEGLADGLGKLFEGHLEDAESST